MICVFYSSHEIKENLNLLLGIKQHCYDLTLMGSVSPFFLLDPLNRSCLLLKSFYDRWPGEN